MLRWLAILLALLLALGLRVLVMSSLDLSDLPGPASAQLVVMAMHNPAANEISRLLAYLIAWTGWDPVTTTQRAVGLAGLFSVLGVALAAEALGGWAAAVAAALITASWAPFLLQWIMAGMDPFAGGATILGLGLCIQAIRRSGPQSLLLAGLGGYCALLGVGGKATALPALVCLALLPFLTRSRRPLSLLALAAAALGAWLATPILMSGLAGGAPRGMAEASSCAPGWESLVYGCRRIAGLSAMNREGYFLPLLLSALAGALLPGPAWRERMILALLTLSGLGYTACTLGDQIKLRYLVFGSFGLLVLSGCGVAGLLRLGSLALRNQVHTLPVRHAGRLMGVFLALAGLSVNPLVLLDGLASIRAWSETRVVAMAAEPDRLPSFASWLSSSRHAREFDSSLGLFGGKELLAFGRSASKAGIAGFPLSDSRETVLELGAFLADRRVIILTADRACAGRPPDADCAQETVTRVERERLDLLLPTDFMESKEAQIGVRVEARDRAWLELLRAQALSRREPDISSPWWHCWRGR